MSRTDELVYSKAFFKFNDNFRFEFPWIWPFNLYSFFSSSNLMLSNKRNGLVASLTPELLQVIITYLLPKYPYIIQQTGNENIQTYQVEVVLRFHWGFSIVRKVLK